jgi:hypothetical protein
VSARAGDLHPDTTVLSVGEAAMLVQRERVNAERHRELCERVVMLVTSGVAAELLTATDCEMAFYSLRDGAPLGEVIDFLTLVTDRALDAEDELS